MEANLGSLLDAIRLTFRFRAFLRGPSQTRPSPRRWFYTLTFFVPRAVRAPALDHIIEDQERLWREGYPAWLIDLMTVSQCVWLVLRAFVGFAWDVFNPFKSRISGDK